MKPSGKEKTGLPGTLHNFLQHFDQVPVASAWYLSDLGEARGLQELYTRLGSWRYLGCGQIQGP